MRKGVVRVLLTLATIAVVWLVAAPAMAATRAPVCDPRGAIAFAPPPQIQDLEQSLDVVLNEDDCTSPSTETRHVERDRAPRLLTWSAQEPAAAPPAVMAVRGGGERVLAPAAPAGDGARPGYRASLDRPPRA